MRSICNAKSQTTTFQNARKEAPHTLQSNCAFSVRVPELSHAEASSPRLPELRLLQRSLDHYSEGIVKEGSPWGDSFSS